LIFRWSGRRKSEPSDFRSRSERARLRPKQPTGYHLSGTVQNRSGLRPCRSGSNPCPIY
jgi:hypothetical protein